MRKHRIKLKNTAIKKAKKKKQKIKTRLKKRTGIKVQIKPGIKSKKLILNRRKPRKLTRSKKPALPARPTYILDTDFGSFFELRDLILKSLPAEKNTMIERINKLGRIKLAVISGVFMNKDNPDPYVPDLLIVGDDLDKRKLRSFLKAIEAEVGKEIKYVILDKEEFQYRLAMFDRFIRVLFEGPHEKLINRLGI